MAATDGPPEGMRALLCSLAILHLLTPELRELVVESFEERSYAFGDYVVVEGEPSDAFYVVTEGVVRVIGVGPAGEEVSLNLLRPGDSFGEGGLLENSPRTRSVRATGPVAAARLDGSVFRSLVRLHPEIRAAFEAQGRARRLQSFLRIHPSFSVLGPDALARLVGDGAERRVTAGERVVTEGETAASWWVVLDGRLTVYTSAPARRDVQFLRTGDLFGELALLQGGSRAAAVEATTDATLLEFPAATFTALLRERRFRERVDERLALYARGPARRPVDFAPADGGDSGRVDEPAAGTGRPSFADPRIADGVELEDDPPPAAPWRAPRRGFPLVRQIDEADCGAACVAMLCRAFGHRVSLHHIRHAVGTGQQGTTLAGIRRGGEEVGLAMRAVKSSAGRVAALTLPAVVHWEGNHWVVLYRVETDHVRLADPAGRLRRVPMAEFAEHWSGYAAVAAPTPALRDAPRERLQVAWLVPLLRPQRKRLWLAVGLALLATGAGMVPPILSQSVIDAVLADRGAGRVHLLIAIMVAVLLAGLAASLLQRRILARVAVEVDGEALDFVTGRLLGLPMSYFQSRRTGDIERRLNGLRQLRAMMVQRVPAVLAGVAQLVVTVVIMCVYSWIVALAFLATAPIYALLMRYSAKLLRPTFDELEEAYARHASKQIDAIKGMEAVKIAGAEPGVRQRIREEFTTLAHKVFKGDFVLMSYDAGVQLASFLVFVGFLWISALLALAGSLSVGEVVAINSLVLLANGPIFALLGFWDQMQIAHVLLQRLQDVLEHEAEQPDGDGALRAVASLEGRITLRGVGLHYRDAPDRRVLDDVSLQLEPGMTLGLVGRSGSGKSSLLQCLAGLLVPTRGAILYDGVDLRELRWSELRRRIGFVLQEPYLFDDTIAANIALGERVPDPGRVLKAAEIADAAGFIGELALGYETRVGDSGLRLSGGQAQRVAIARALYHDPPVVLFDEATSALDAEAERAVKENLDRAMANRTTVVVAHRLSTVRDADLIGVLEQGRLVELGDHEQLMAREGLYHYLNTVQLDR